MSGLGVRVKYQATGGARSIDDWVRRYSRELPGKILHPALRDAAKRTVMKTRTRAVRRLARRSKLPVGVVKKRTYFAKGGIGKTRGAIVGLVLYSRGIGATALKARPTKKGVKAGKHLFEGAFLGAGIGGNVQAFSRKGKARLPLNVHRVPFRDTEQVGVILRRYSQTFMPRRFQQQVKRRIGQTSWGRGSRRAV